MPVYVYKCTACGSVDEVLMDPSPPVQLEGGVCLDGENPCDMQRQFVAPSIGFVPGAGSSPSRPSLG